MRPLFTTSDDGFNAAATKKDHTLWTWRTCPAGSRSDESRPEWQGELNNGTPFGALCSSRWASRMPPQKGRAQTSTAQWTWLPPTLTMGPSAAPTRRRRPSSQASQKGLDDRTLELNISKCLKLSIGSRRWLDTTNASHFWAPLVVPRTSASQLSRKSWAGQRNSRPNSSVRPLSSSSFASVSVGHEVRARHHPGSHHTESHAQVSIKKGGLGIRDPVLQRAL